jgi:twitching motility two-component system response regulator PilG
MVRMRGFVLMVEPRGRHAVRMERTSDRTGAAECALSDDRSGGTTIPSTSARAMPGSPVESDLNEDLHMSEPAVAAELTGLKVLVIDDSNTIRRSAEIFLKQAGCDVVLAEDGFDALAKIVDRKPDLIFCDIMMPRLDGYQTCVMLKSNPKYADVPVIMLSSKDGLFDRARGNILGSAEYLTKPFSKDSLLKAARQHASRNAGS